MTSAFDVVALMFNFHFRLGGNKFSELRLIAEPREYRFGR